MSSAAAAAGVGQGGPVARAAPLTIGEALGQVAPDLGWPELWHWPPDVFAATSVLLAQSGAYRHVVCPPRSRSWPPAGLLPHGVTWDEAIRCWADDWARWLDDAGPRPEALAEHAAVADGARALPLAELAEEAGFDVVTSLLVLHATADEASAGAGLRFDTPLQRRAAACLTETGSLSRLAPDRLRVLPKLRPPESGITVRSLSRHLALDRSEIETRWYVSRQIRADQDVAAERLTLLLVPYPAVVHASDFRAVRGPLLNMDERTYGFYEFEPAEPFDPHEIVALVATAARHVGSIDAVVLPEASVEDGQVTVLQELLWQAGVPLLLAGVRARPGEAGPFGANYAYLGTADWRAAPQHKHHRWLLDSDQVHQYHLGAALDPRRGWWEAINVHRRGLTFATISDWLTICPLVCEDLARPDPVSEVVRAVGPTLVVGLLLDGPQLASRWPARYASVLADDPGCSVLTLTALGMAERSQPAGCPPSRVIALWKDPHRGLQEIPLAAGARAVAATAHVRIASVSTADGRRSTAPELVLSGLEQVR